MGLRGQRRPRRGATGGRRRTDHRVLRAVLRPDLLGGVVDAGRRPRPQPPSLRGLDHLAGGALHPGPLRRPGRHRARRAVDGRVPRGAVRAAAPARVRPVGVAVRQLRPVGLARLGRSDDESYFTSPFQFLPNTHGEHLDYLRSRLFLTLVVGSGMWEDRTGSNDSTRALGAVFADKDIPHELYVWGTEWPHDWPSWRAQAARATCRRWADADDRASSSEKVARSAASQGDPAHPARPSWLAALGSSQPWWRCSRRRPTSVAHDRQTPARRRRSSPRSSPRTRAPASGRRSAAPPPGPRRRLPGRRRARRGSPRASPARSPDR